MNFAMETPPELSGDITVDLQAIRDYLEELIDELEYAFSEVNYGE